MAHQIHRNARTTPRIREEIQRSEASQAELAKRYSISRKTVGKWQKRERTEDGSHRPHTLHTRLSEAQEEIVVELRKTLFLSIDDLLVVTREFIDPKASRSGIGRLLARHGISNLNQLMRETTGENAKPETVKTFKDYTPGFLHIDIKYLPQMPDEKAHRYLFVAIDRATRWVFFFVYDRQSEASSVDFLGKALENCPAKVTKVLTDNGSQFTDRFTAKDKKPSGNHAFDRACHRAGVEHRLAPLRHPQTNGMVERFNGRISQIVRQTRFASSAQLERTLHEYARVYNHHIPQRALNHLSPIESMLIWQKSHPACFVRNVTNQTGLDNYPTRGQDLEIFTTRLNVSP